MTGEFCNGQTTLSFVKLKRNTSTKRHYFHYAAGDGLIFLCMCDEQFPRRIAFGFLEDIKNRFLAVYKTSFKDALPFAMNEEFSRVLQRQMVRVFLSKFVSPLPALLACPFCVGIKQICRLICYYSRSIFRTTPVWIRSPWYRRKLMTQRK